MVLTTQIKTMIGGLQQKRQITPGVTTDFKCSIYTFLKVNCVISTLVGHQMELQEILKCSLSLLLVSRIVAPPKMHTNGAQSC